MQKAIRGAGISCAAVLAALALCLALPLCAHADQGNQADQGTSLTAAVAALQAGDAQLESQDVAERTFSVQASGDKPMYRLYNMFSGEHLYTAAKGERNKLVKIGWFYEGIGWMAPSSGSPVYRLYNKWSGDHHYTLDAKERDRLVKKGWRNEGIAWYSAAANDAEAQPLLRQFNRYATTGTHNYTISQKENDKLVKKGWRAEGVGWYGYTVPADYADDMQPWKADISGDEWLDRNIYYITKTHTSLRSCFDYVVYNFHYISGNRFWSNPHVLSDKTTAAYAKEFLKNGGGNCYRYACLFSWLARGLGYKTNVISGWVPSLSGGQAPHGWVEVYKDGQTYVCDPDLAHEIPGHGWYMCTYGGAPIQYGSW